MNKENNTKLTSSVGERKAVNVKPQIKTLNSRKRKEQQMNSAEAETKRTMKKKCRTKSEKVPAKTNTKASLKLNEKLNEQQALQLNATLKESLNCSKLTHDELKILYLKYKIDGHYRPSKNLPLLSSLVDNAEINKSSFHSRIMQEMSYRNNKTENVYLDSNENQHDKENLNLYRNMQQNFKHNPWMSKDVKEISAEDKTGNRYWYAENSAINSNYNRVAANYDIQTCSNANVFNYTHFDHSQEDLNASEVPNVEKQFLYNASNSQSVFSEDYQSCGYAGKNFFYNAPDANRQYENLNNYEMLQQSNTKHLMHSTDLPMNLNLYGDNYLNKRNNVNRNNNQAWKDMDPLYTSYGNVESHYGVRNLSTEQNNLNSHGHTNAYHLIDNENATYIINNSNVNVQQDFNSFYAPSSTVTSDNTVLEETFIPSYINSNDHV